MNTREWVADFYNAIDTGDLARFERHFAGDVEFRFGNGAPLTGAAATRAVIADFAATLKGMQHALHHVWHAGDATFVEGATTYTRNDGTVVVIPFFNVFRTQDERVVAWRIYNDMAPLSAAR